VKLNIVTIEITNHSKNIIFPKLGENTLQYICTKIIFVIFNSENILKKVEMILNIYENFNMCFTMIPHILNHVCEPCEKFDLFHKCGFLGC